MEIDGTYGEGLAVLIDVAEGHAAQLEARKGGAAGQRLETGRLGVPGCAGKLGFHRFQTHQRLLGSDERRSLAHQVGDGSDAEKEDGDDLEPHLAVHRLRDGREEQQHRQPQIEDGGCHDRRARRRAETLPLRAVQLRPRGERFGLQGRGRRGVHLELGKTLGELLDQPTLARPHLIQVGGCLLGVVALAVKVPAEQADGRRPHQGPDGR